MLKYFKRQRSRRSHDDDINSIDDGVDIPDSAKRNSLRSTSSFCDEVFFEDETTTVSDSEGGCGTSIAGGSTSAFLDEDIFKYQSRLSMTLPAIVSDQHCLSYFVQYLETKNGLPLIKFFLDTENFKTSALTQLDIEQKSALMKASLEHVEQESEPEPTQSVGDKCNEHSDSEETKKVPELKTLCDLSMRKPLTDDEKSQIYAETNKKITKCSLVKIKSPSELSLCSQTTNVTEPEAESECLMTNNSCISAASIKDAIAIYQKYLIDSSQQFVSLPVAILSQISLMLCKRDDAEKTSKGESLQISASCFDGAQQYVLQQLENEYLHDFLQSIFYCNYCIDIIENLSKDVEAKLTISDILFSEVSLFFFMEFLEQQHERDCLDFWTAAINFRKSYYHADDPDLMRRHENEAQADAMIIYEKYFSLQSDCRLWMSDKLRSKVEESICAVGKVCNCFDLPLQVTAKYLEKKYLDRFLKSQLFENYLNELKLKVNEDLSLGSLTKESPASRHNSVKRSKYSCHRKTMSDCSNEDSRVLLKNISQHNTLLAMESPSPNKMQATSTGSFNIDSSQLTNPNTLWTRSNSSEGGLKFGRVNALGRYERDFEIDAICNGQRHNWSLASGGSKFKNAMRKLVNLPEERVQEEIAWQVAEMIVKDVTSVTLCGTK